jgi:hypothetical protein
MQGCLVALSLLCFFIGFVQLLLPVFTQGIQARNQKPLSIDDDLPIKMDHANKDVHVAAQKSTGGYSTISEMRSGAHSNLINPGITMPEFQSTQTEQPKQLAWIQTGERIRVHHPQAGDLTLYVDGKVTFVELWQTQRGAQSPWVPTGSCFAGFWLETGRFLLNWQNRTYILDESAAVTDSDIQRDFKQYARKFAESDQTADVYFAYPPAMWHMDDIGKFRVGEMIGGSGMQTGGVGRFIHASGDSQRALVLNDFDGAGGQDMVWTGYRIEADDIQPA